MGILSSAFQSPTSEKALSLYELLRGTTGWAAGGKNVTTKTAIEVSTVFACCRVIGEGVAQVPLKLILESDNGKSKLPQKKNPLYKILNIRPNSFQTSFEYREMLVWHMMLTGNHFSFINRGSRGNILELIPFEPGQVTVKQASDWTLTYKVRAQNGESKTFPAEAIWHVKGPSWDGWMGLDAVKTARNAIGLAMSIEKSSDNLHENGVNPSGMYSVEGTLDDAGYKELSEWIATHHAGAENRGKPMILDRAAKWVSNQMTSVDAQSLESRRFQIEEICRFARVMPIMVGHSEKAATYASAEQMFLAHLVHTLSPWYERLEQSINVNLLTEKERDQGLYADFVEEGLLRASAESTQKILLGYVSGGLMTQNEGRSKLDMNPVDDPEADKLHLPQNIVGAAQASSGSQNDQTKSFETRLNSLETRAPTMPNITVNQAPVQFKAGETVVNVPEMKAPDVTVHFDAPPPADIKVNVEIPEIKAGDITVEQPAITLEATMPTPNVIVSMPARRTETDVIRDDKGNIVKATQVETDV